VYFGYLLSATTFQPQTITAYTGNDPEKSINRKSVNLFENCGGPYAPIRPVPLAKAVIVQNSLKSSSKPRFIHPVASAK